MSATKTTASTATHTAGSTTTAARTDSATRLMEDAVRGWGEAMNTWLDAQHRLLGTAMASMPAMPTPEACVPVGGEARRVVEQMSNQMRGSANRVFHGSVDLAMANMNDMTAMFNEQSRFMGRLAERAADCMLGEHAARTPEAFTATVRTMMADCVENSTVASEQMVRVGARSMDTVRTMVEGEVAAHAPAGTGTGTTTAATR